MTRNLFACFVAAALVFTAGAAAAQNCSMLRFRVEKDREATWFEPGEEVSIPLEGQVDIYVQVESRSRDPYLASARIGRPDSMGRRAPRGSADVLALTAQKAEDVRMGRIRLGARDEGLGHLGFQLEGVHPPGDLATVPENCRTGLIAVRAAGCDEEENPTRPQPSSGDWSLDENLRGIGGLQRQGAGRQPLPNLHVVFRANGNAALRFDGAGTTSHWSGTWERVNAGELRVRVEPMNPDVRGSADGTARLVPDGLARIDLAGTLDGSFFEIDFQVPMRTTPPGR